ncbi:hypothetical protein NKG05_10015 [Oerskovia sp. M15]
MEPQQASLVEVPEAQEPAAQPQVVAATPDLPQRAVAAQAQAPAPVQQVPVPAEQFAPPVVEQQVPAAVATPAQQEEIPDELSFEALPRFEDLMADLPTRRSLRESQARKRASSTVARGRA